MSGTSTPTVDPYDLPEIPLPRFRPGDRIAGRYEVLRFLGSGGSACVYAVRDLTVGDELALKVLRPEKSSQLHLERSRREAELARSAASARFVRTFDLDEADGLCFLTMELVRGGSLRDRLREGPLPIAEVMRLAEEILEALDDLHALRIVHRDLKPGNLLLTTDGHVKLTDFGVARRWDDDRARLTRTGMPVGTIAYLSPEQARCEPVDARTDLYAFGVVLYEMLTGRVPFEAPSAVGALLLRFNERPPDVRQLRPDTPPWLAAMLDRLLQKDRALRYDSARAVLADLRRRRAHRPVRILPMAVIAATVLLAIGGMLLYARWSRPTIVADGDYGARAIGAGGRTLWVRKDMRAAQYAFVRRGLFARLEIATVLAPEERPKDPELVRVLSFLDARTGRVLRTASLPWPRYAFREFSAYFGVAQVARTDLDDDGAGELVIVYHHAYYPSYAVVHDPRRDDSRVVFVASGHGKLVATEDVDGDGTRELIFTGISNRFGWYRALAAVRVDPGGDPTVVAYTPDHSVRAPEGALLWYVLAPPGAAREPAAVTVDRRKRQFHLHYVPPGKPFVVSFDGFAAGSSSPLSPRQRAAAREAAFAHVREAQRLAGTGIAAQAVAEAEAAEALARRAGDALLVQWCERVKGGTLVQARRLDEAQRIFERFGGDADAAWDAGRAFHLAGELPRAVEWYRRALLGHPWSGRMKYEAVEGLVLALVEMGRGSEALAEINRYAAAYREDAMLPLWYRRYVEWRSGAAPDPPPSPGDFDLPRYWLAEMLLARGDDPRAVLGVIEREEKVMSYFTYRALLRSARAETLARLGREGEALQAARDAWNELRAELRIDPAARAHLDLVVERVARLAAARGFHAEAAAARRELQAVRWRSRPPAG